MVKYLLFRCLSLFHLVRIIQKVNNHQNLRYNIPSFLNLPVCYECYLKKAFVFKEQSDDSDGDDNSEDEKPKSTKKAPNKRKAAKTPPVCCIYYTCMLSSMALLLKYMS